MILPQAFRVVIEFLREIVGAHCGHVELIDEIQTSLIRFRLGQVDGWLQVGHLIGQCLQTRKICLQRFWFPVLEAAYLDGFENVLSDLACLLLPLLVAETGNV